MRLLGAYLRDLVRETVATLVFLAGVVAAVALALWPDAPESLPTWQWGLVLGVAGFLWANFELYRRYSPASPIARALAGTLDPVQLAQGIRDLARMDSRSARRELRRALSSPVPDVRRAAALCLAALNDARAVPQLRCALLDESAPDHERVTATAHLKRLAGASAVPALATVLTSPRPTGDTDDVVRAAAAEALADLGTDEAVTALSVAQEDPTILAPLVDLLAAAGTSSAAAALVAQYDRLDYQTPAAEAIVALLGGMGDEALPVLLEETNDHVLVRVMDALVTRPDLADKIVPYVEEARLRSGALRVLAHHPEGRNHLVAIVGSAPEPLRSQAAESMSETYRGRGWLAELLRDDDEALARAALGALAGTRGPIRLDLASAVRPWLRRGSVELRLTAVEALSRILNQELALSTISIDAIDATHDLAVVASSANEPDDVRDAGQFALHLLQRDGWPRRLLEDARRGGDTRATSARNALEAMSGAGINDATTLLTTLRSEGRGDG